MENDTKIPDNKSLIYTKVRESNENEKGLQDGAK
jgi:hypothetical protein